MGSLRDHVDLAGGLRSGLSDEPPWWARGAIGAFAAVVVLVIVFSAVVGGSDGQPAGPVGGAGPGTGLAGGPVGGAGPGTGPAPPAAAPERDAGATGATDASGGTGGAPVAGPAAAGTVALADRDGIFRQVPRAAVDAARRRGAGLLDLPADEVRHHLVAAGGARVELAVSSLDGDREVQVVVALVDGAWRPT